MLWQRARRHLARVRPGWQADSPQSAGQNKTEVRDKRRDLHSDIEAGIRKPQAVTAQEAAEDWLARGRDRPAATVRKNRDVLTAVLAIIGRERLRELTAADAHAALASVAARRTTATGPYRCMVDRMDKRKVTFLLPAHTMEAARTVVGGGNMSAFVDRALRNETLRAQLAAQALPEVSGWLDDAEADQTDAA